MRIVAWVNNNSGVSFHRIIMPFLLMKDVDVFITNNLLVEHFEKGCDIFIYNRILPEQHMPKIREMQKYYGFKIVVDVDDFWELDTHHLLYDEYQASEFGKHQVQHLKDADVVLTTHERLAAEVMPYNSNVHICANAIPRQGQFDIERIPCKFTRLFWQGSATHRADMMILQRPIDQLADVASKIKMVMAGYVQDSEEWHTMALAYTANIKHQYKLIPAAKVEQYYNAYAEADVCLVPLIKSRFNGFKSNLKILEAANMGLPVIASEVDPYLNMPVMYCKTGMDWQKHIRRMIGQRGRQKEWGEALRSFCDTHYNFHKINKERKQILEHAASKISA